MKFVAAGLVRPDRNRPRPRDKSRGYEHRYVAAGLVRPSGAFGERALGSIADLDPQQCATDLDLVARSHADTARVAAMDDDDVAVADDRRAVAAAFVEEPVLAGPRVEPQARVGTADSLGDAVDRVE